MPSAESIARALELIAKGRSQYDYFFDNLEDPAWIEPLLKAGFFTSPRPPVVVSGEGTMHPYWPESQYLLRMAERAPDAVAAAVREIPETENVRVTTDICQIGAALPGEFRLEIGKKVRTETRDRPIFFLLPEAMRELIAAIAAAGESKFAVHFAAELLELKTPEAEEALPPRPVGRMGAYEYEELARKLIPELALSADTEALDLACDLLQGTIEARGERESPRDYSDFWKPMIEDEQGNRAADVVDGLVAATRDASLALIDEGDAGLGEVVERLRARGWQIFVRIALYAAAECADSDADVARRFAVDPSLLREAPIDVERDRLVAAVARDLHSSQLESYLGGVGEGPTFPSSEDADRDRQRIEIWQRDRLAPVAERLDDRWKQRFDELVESYGPPQPGRPRATAYWTGPTSPMNEQEMAGMPASTVIDFIADWTPEQTLRSPSAEGLARVLQERVKSSPMEFRTLAERISGLDPTYVRAVLEGFAAAAKDGVEVPWREALALIELAVESPPLEESPERREHDDRDPDWRWTRKAAASLIENVTQNDLLAPELSEQTWGSLRELSWDGEPDAAYERRYGGTNMDPLTLSLNTTRGEAMHAVVAFAVWAAQHEDTESLKTSLGNLADHLDPTVEPSGTIRGVFGARLNQLHAIAPEWTAEKMELLFPADEGLRHLRVATWDTYVMWGRPSPTLFELLESQYRTAVEELPVEAARVEAARRDPGEALAEHLATFLWWGAIGTEPGGLAADFFARASAKQAAHLLTVLGRSLAEERNAPVGAEVIARIEALWSALPGWIAGRSLEERSEILAGFGDLYASGAFEDSWADRELLALAGEGVLAGAEYVVFDRLVARAAVAAETPLRFALALVDNPPKPWSIDAHREDLGKIVEIGLAGPERELAEQLVNQLVAKGHREFRDRLIADPDE
ncbi:MAG: hypothetical protein QM729_18080 [Solirubrobacterales bacterium]